MSALLDVVAATGPGLVGRATVVFVLASALAVALRAASAAERHLVWSAALAAALALPVIHLAAPAWHVLPLVGTESVGAGPAADGPIYQDDVTVKELSRFPHLLQTEPPLFG